MSERMIDQARRLVADRFPDALAALLAGSAAAGTATATATSDLDLAVLVADGGGTYRETVRHEGRVVELFVHTGTGLAELFAVDAASRRAVLQNMYATGLLLTDPDGHGARARERAEADLRQGPPALAPETVETRRYGLTDLLADLADAGDARDVGDARDARGTGGAAERLAIAGEVLTAAADLLWDHCRAWTGAGKWLPRRLREADPVLGPALVDGHLRLCRDGDPQPLAQAARQVLDLVGGPLSEGYRRTWHGTIERTV
ncbi:MULTISPECIES: nucleotidyltransferase domain-containing protein [unclassified Kitasatospora]|uniref:nucleotidyltransferase domain-containing protein n=1 Tax=unclassified Kitasatospora TaxID=2633591 RepID=UPI0033C74F2B